MQIDWLTVSAQIVNFLVLAWLLHRFLYGPITRAMERREQRIARRLSDARQMHVEAEKEAQAFRDEKKALEDQREQFLATARDAAAQERNRLIEEARRDAADQKQRWLDDLEQQRTGFVRDIREHARTNFFAMARRALGDLANAELQDQMSQVFAEKLSTLDDEARDRLATAGRENGNGTIVRSGFALTPESERRITQTIQKEILTDAHVSFERMPELICGLELKMGGQTIAWNLESYFETLERMTADEIGNLTRLQE